MSKDGIVTNARYSGLSYFGNVCANFWNGMSYDLRAQGKPS